MEDTVRRMMREFLKGGPKTVREISQELGIPEKEALDHLAHLMKGDKEGRLRIEPAKCHTCGYVFTKRERPGKPGRCPVCKGERISQPLYLIQ